MSARPLSGARAIWLAAALAVTGVPGHAQPQAAPLPAAPAGAAAADDVQAPSGARKVAVGAAVGVVLGLLLVLLVLSTAEVE